MGKGAAMTKGALADALAAQCELKRSQCTKAINCLAEIAAKEVKGNGVFTVPGLCKIKTKVKPATKAGKREMFGQTVIVKAKSSEDGREGVPSGRPQEKHLILARF